MKKWQPQTKPIINKGYPGKTNISTRLGYGVS